MWKDLSAKGNLGNKRMSSETDNTGGLQPEYKAYKHQKCFVGHSHEAEWRDDILSACVEVLPKSGLEPWYAAEYFEPTKPLRDKVVTLIANTLYGIYDLSSWQDRNSEWHSPNNVYIELGMAIALNRPALLLRHTSNRNLLLPECLQNIELVEFAGEATLKKALEERLPRWLQTPPDRDWLSRFCIFGNRVCGFREEHPRARQWGQQKLACHISDGLDINHPDFQNTERLEIRRAFEDVLGRYNNLSFLYFDELSFVDGYQFLLCSHCQAVRSTPFAVYRITPSSPAEVFIAIGMSIALETLFEYKIPNIVLVRREQDLPSLLRGYEVVEAVTSSEVKRKLWTFIPDVIKKVRETVWKPRPLPFFEPELVDMMEFGIQSESMKGEIIEDFSELLRKLLERSQITPRSLSRLTNLPKPTIDNWLNGVVHKPRDRSSVVKVAMALRLSKDETNQLLRSAHHESMEEGIDSMPPSFLTRQGFQKLQEELEYLRIVKRKEVAQRLHEAVEGSSDLGVDLDAEYEAAKNEQAFVEGRIQELEILLANAHVIEESRKSDTIQIGSKVTIQETGTEPESYIIVDPAEANPREGRISSESPLGRALMEHRVGDTVRVEAPGGTFTVQVVQVV